MISGNRMIILRGLVLDFDAFWGGSVGSVRRRLARGKLRVTPLATVTF